MGLGRVRLSSGGVNPASVSGRRPPPQQNEKRGKLTDNDRQLEGVIRPESIEVGDRIGGLIERIPNVGGAPDVKALVDRVPAFYEKTNDFTADFKQDYTYKAFKRTQRSSG